jgi:hypothetical protein
MILPSPARHHCNRSNFDFAGFTGTNVNSPRFTGFANIAFWRVSIWSSEAQARENFLGDVFRASVSSTDAAYLGGQPVIPAGGLLPGQVSRAQVTLPLVKELAAGTYWLGVTPFMSFSLGQTGIFRGGTGTGNAIQVNSSGGFGFPGGVNETGASAAFRLNGTGGSAGAVPEPASWAMLIAGFGLTGAAMRRRRVSAVSALA